MIVSNFIGAFNYNCYYFLFPLSIAVNYSPLPCLTGPVMSVPTFRPFCCENSLSVHIRKITIISKWMPTIIAL